MFSKALSFLGHHATHAVGKGVAGITAVQMTDSIMPGGSDQAEILKAIAQAIIAICTIVSLLLHKEKKEK